MFNSKDIKTLVFVEGVTIRGAQKYNEGDRVQLMCETTGPNPVPEARFEWYFRGQRISSSPMLRFVHFVVMCNISNCEVAGNPLSYKMHCE